MKYICTEIAGIITQIAVATEIEGYTEGVLQVLLPDENQMTEKEQKIWIKKSNERMKKICKFMNENKL